MPARTVFLARLIGLFALVTGAAMLAHKQAMVETAGALVRERPLVLILGMTALAVGLALVLAHNVWSGGALPIVVTLFGWVILLRGMLLLFLPPEGAARLLDLFRFEQLFYLYAGLTVLLGLYLVYAGFRRK